MKTTYVVWCKTTGYASSEYSIYDAAMREAERLAGEFPGDLFAVLKVLSVCTMKDVQEVKWEYPEADPWAIWNEEAEDEAV